MRFAAAVLLLLAVSACGGETAEEPAASASKPALESTESIEQGIKPDYISQSEEILGEDLGFDPVIDCPDTAAQSAGDEFECFVYDADDETQKPVSILKVSFPNDTEYQWRAIS